MLAWFTLLAFLSGAIFLVRWVVEKLQSNQGPLLLNNTLAFFLPNFHKSINFSSLSLFPFMVRDFEYISKRSRSSVQLALKWKVMRMEFNPMEWFRSNFTSELAIVHIQGLDMTLPNLRFKDILVESGSAQKRPLFTSNEDAGDNISGGDESSSRGDNSAPKDTERDGKKLTRLGFLKDKLANAFLVSLTDSSFEACMIAVEHVIIGDCARMEVKPCKSAIGNAIVVTMDDSKLKVGRYLGRARRSDDAARKLHVNDIGKPWMNYVSTKAIMTYDTNATTRLKDMLFELQGPTDVTLQLETFLELYKTYQNEEDNALEIKLLRGAGGGGSMRKMGFKCASAAMELYDNRCADPIEVSVTALDAWLEKGNFMNGDASTKTMCAIIEGVTFPKYPGIEVNGISANKVLTVRGEAHNFIDVDNMEGKIADVKMQWLDAFLLRWLLVLQHVSDNMPNSRFSHIKDVHIKMAIGQLYFGSASSGAMRGLGLRRVFMSAEEATILMDRSANSTMTAFNMQASSFKMITSSPQHALSDTYCIDSIDPSVPFVNGGGRAKRSTTDERENSLRVDILWDFTDICFQFDLGATIAFRRMRASDFSLQETFVDSQAPPTDLLTPAWSERYHMDAAGTSEVMKPTDMSMTWTAEQDIDAEMGAVVLRMGIATLLRLLFSYSQAMAFVNYLTLEQRDVKEVWENTRGKSRLTADLSRPTHRRVASTTSTSSGSSGGGAGEYEALSSFSFMGTEGEFMDIKDRFSSDDISARTVKETPPASTAPAKKSVSILVKISDLAVHFFNIDDKRGQMDCSLNLCFSDFQYGISGLSTTHKWDAAVISANMNPDYDFITMGASCATLTKAAEPGCPSYTKFETDTFHVHLKQFTQQHEIIQALTEQYSCMSMSMSRPKAQQYGHALPFNPSILELNLSIMEVHISGLHDGIVLDDLATLAFKGIHVVLDSSATQDTHQASIAALDLKGRLDKYVYGGITGGQLALDVEQFSLDMRPLPTATVVGLGGRITGTLYICTLLHDRVRTTTVARLCDPLRHSTLQEGVVTDIFPEVRTVLVSSSSHQNVFHDLRLDMENLNIAVDPKLAVVLADTIACFQECLNGPPQVDLHPMNTWDSLAYYLHGKIVINCMAFQLKFAVSNSSSTMSIEVAGERVSIGASREELSFRGTSLLIDAVFVEDGEDGQILSKRNTTGFSTTSTATGGSDTKVVSSRISYMPSMTASLAMVMSTADPYNHHDIYIFPNTTTTDRYMLFRSHRQSIKCKLRVHCFDPTAVEGFGAEDSGVGNPFTVFLRVDIIGKIVAFFHESSDQVEAEPTSPPPLTATTKSRPESNGGTCGVSVHDEGVTVPDTSLLFGPMELIERIDILFKMDDFLMSSWVSPSNRIGATTQQRMLFVSIRMVHQTSVDNTGEDNSGLSLDYLVASAKQSQYYVRNWSVLDEYDNDDEPDNSDMDNAGSGEDDHVMTRNRLFADPGKYRDSASSSPFGYSRTRSGGELREREPRSAPEVQGLFEDVYRLASSELVEVTFADEARAGLMKSTSNTHEEKSATTTMYSTDGTRSHATQHSTVRPHRKSTDFDVHVDLNFDSGVNKDVDLFSEYILGSSSAPTHPTKVRWSSASSAHGAQGESVTGQSEADSTQLQKTWSVTVQDIHLLWSISLRDELYSYLDGIMRGDKAGMIADLVEANATDNVEALAPAAERPHNLNTPMVRRGDRQKGHQAIFTTHTEMSATSATSMDTVMSSAATLRDFPRATGITDLTPRHMLDLLDERIRQTWEQASKEEKDRVMYRPSAVKDGGIGGRRGFLALPGEEGGHSVLDDIDGIFSKEAAISVEGDSVEPADHEDNNSRGRSSSPWQISSRATSPSVADEAETDEGQSQRRSSHDSVSTARPRAGSTSSSASNMRARGDSDLSDATGADERTRRKSDGIRDPLREHRRSIVLGRARTGTTIIPGSVMIKETTEQVGKALTGSWNKVKGSLTERLSMRRTSTSSAVSDGFESAPKDSQNAAMRRMSSFAGEKGTLGLTKVPSLNKARTQRRPSLRDAPILRRVNTRRATTSTSPGKSSQSRVSSGSNFSFPYANSAGEDEFGYGSGNASAATSPMTATGDSQSQRAMDWDHINDGDGGQDDGMRRFFTVELNNMQFNFLDEKTHSSIILIAKQAHLDGVHSLAGSARDNCEFNEEVKRRNEICLSTFEVSMYTASDLDKRQAADSRSNEEERMAEDAYAQVPCVSTSMDTATGAHRDRDDAGPIHHRVLWYEHHPDFLQSPDRFRAKAAPANNEDLRLAIENFRLGAQYTFYTTITVQDAHKMDVEYTKEELEAAFKIELPNFNMVITSVQFNVISAVLRNVLLAIPPTNSELTNAVERMKTRRKEIPTLGPKMPFRDKYGHIDVAVLQKMIERWMIQEQHTLQGIARSNEIFVGRGTWILQGDEGEGDVMKVTFTGLYAMHSFEESECTSTLLEVQRFSASTDNYGEEAKYAFGNDCAGIIVNVLNDKELCSRCGTPFDIDSNNPDSCRIHADAHGWPGWFTNGSWSCCGARALSARGCQGRPHINKEMMICIRAEAHPAAGVDNIDVSALSTLNISIFPEANYILQVQLTAKLQAGLHKYFSIDEPSASKAAMSKSTATQKFSKTKPHLGEKAISSTNVARAMEDDGPTLNPLAMAGRMPSMRLGGGDVSHHPNSALAPDSTASDKMRPSTERKRGHRRSVSYSGELSHSNMSGLVPFEGNGDMTPALKVHGAIGRSKRVSTATMSGGERPHQRDSATSVMRAHSRSHSRSGSGSGSDNLSELAQLAQKANEEEADSKRGDTIEGLYIKYVRVGGIRLSVKLAGFLIPLKLNLVMMEPYIEHSQVFVPGSWGNFITALETHAFNSVIRGQMQGWATYMGMAMSRLVLGSKDEYKEEDEEGQRKKFLLGLH